MLCSGIGATVGYSSVTRDTEAFVGDANGTAGSGSNAVIGSAGNVIVDAKNSGLLGTLSLAAAKVSSNSGSTFTNFSTSDPNSTSGQTISWNSSFWSPLPGGDKDIGPSTVIVVTFQATASTSPGSYTNDATTTFTMLEGIAKPMPMEPPERE